MIPRVKGTQDFLDLTLYNFLIDKTRKHLETAAFTEISTPILEHTDLFKRSLGLHTEVVSKEMYTISNTSQTGDEGASEKLCLRPEATASTMRAFFNNAIEKRPWKVFSYGPVFRHERPQKGRFRQFNQMNIEIIGAHSIAYDAQLLALIDDFFRNKLKLTSFALHLNFLGTAEDRIVYKEILREFLEEHDTLPSKINELKDKNILRIFDLKDTDCKEVLKNAPLLTDHLSPSSQAEWKQLKALLKELAIPFTCDPRLVRGLDYYNKTVFEFVSNQLGSQNAIGGGGRYDYLSQALGEKEAVPSLGMAFGIERVLMILEQQYEQLSLPSKPALQMIMPMSAEQQSHALACVELLRKNNITCDAIFDTASMKHMMRKADKAKAEHVIIIGEDEVANNYYTIKNMVTGIEERLETTKLVGYFKR